MRKHNGGLEIVRLADVLQGPLKDTRCKGKHKVE